MLAEIGIKPVKMMIKKKKLIYDHRIITMKEEKLIHKVTAGNSIWRQEIELILKEYNITEQQMSNYSKKELSNELDRRNESLWKKNNCRRSREQIESQTLDGNERRNTEQKTRIHE